MRFVSFTRVDEMVTRFGFIAKSGEVVDLVGAYSALLCEGTTSDQEQPANHILGDALSFIAGGETALALARKVEAMPAYGAHAFSLDVIKVLAPIMNPRKFIAAGKNFSEHMAEISSRIPLPKRPVAFAQMATTIVGPESVIPYPAETQKLDYEVEIAVVIGKPAFRISAEAAKEYIFGYTVFNDISARDLYREEQASGIPLLGKNLPSFSPLGPALVTRDEFSHSPDIKLIMRVNGEVRQQGVLANMIFSIDELVAYWSKIGLEPGDIITTGTPSGVAAGRKPEETPWWLKPGDMMEAEVPGLGTLRNRIGTI